jgi:NAD+ diphosphatase
LSAADAPAAGGRAAGGEAAIGGPAAEAELASPEPGLRPLALARSEVDRATYRQHDERWLARAWAEPGTRVLVVEHGQALTTGSGDDPRLSYLTPAEAPAGVRFLLGVAADDTAYFGVAGPLPVAAETRPAGLREAGSLLSDRDVGLMTQAVALANWHETHTHCPRCGTPTEPFAAGHARRCPADGSEHFPRVDPAMIVLVTDPSDRCLLARNAQWPAGRVSIIAGFVEAGESAEQAVEREVREETGIAVGRVRYLGSQPWPMPRSLMLGFRASATSSQEIAVDGEEILEAHWFSRDELRAAVAAGQVRLPPPVSIAHRIIESWYGTELPGTW